jgi:hypothetical protein
LKEVRGANVGGARIKTKEKWGGNIVIPKLSGTAKTAILDLNF